MKKTILLAALAVFSVATLSAQQLQLQPAPKIVQVTGNAEENVTPDEIFIRVTIRENNTKNTKLSVEAQQADMIKALTALGIDTKNITVSDMASNLKEYALRKDAIKTSKTYQLKVGSAEMVGKVFGALEKIGISDAGVNSYRYSKIDAKRDELRTKAAQDARKTANLLATAIGQKIGKATEIREYGNVGFDEVTYQPMARLALAKSYSNEAVDAETPALGFKEMKLKVSINITFELE